MAEKPKRTSTAIRLRPELHAALALAADERDVSMNWLVNRAVAYYLDRLIPADELTLTREPGAALRTEADR